VVINLSKGGNISLAKAAPSLSHARVGLGWDARSTDGAPFDLDASAFLCGADGRAISDAHFVFYNQTQDAAGSVVHLGDNRTGAGDGDDESIDVFLDQVPAEVETIAIVVSIDQAVERRQNFGMVSNAYVRLFDADNESDATTILFELNEDASTEAAIHFADLYRRNGEWKFRAVGQGWADAVDLAAVLGKFGLVAG
jgi:tellurium resistance protein TerD